LSGFPLSLVIAAAMAAAPPAAKPERRLLPNSASLTMPSGFDLRECVHPVLLDPAELADTGDCILVPLSRTTEFEAALEASLGNLSWRRVNPGERPLHYQVRRNDGHCGDLEIVRMTLDEELAVLHFAYGATEDCMGSER